MEQEELLDICLDYSMVAREHIQWLTEATDEVNEKGVSGALVECGVWKGGCVLAMMLAQNKFGADRNIYLYDSFEGMAEVTGTEEEFEALNRVRDDLCYCSLNDLKQNLSVAEYPSSKTFFIKGDVCETLRFGHLPDSIAILRLDTDFYESTKKELEVLAQRVSVGGYIIIDDYWSYGGCRRATIDWTKSSRGEFKCITPNHGPTARKRYRMAFQRV